MLAETCSREWAGGSYLSHGIDADGAEATLALEVLRTVFKFYFQLCDPV